MSNLVPVKLSPAFKDYLWGGERLRDDFHKACSLERIAESWDCRHTRTVRVPWPRANTRV